MWTKLQRRYFLVLLIPSMLILLLGMWITFYSHSHAMDTMQKDMEVSRQQTMESIGNGIDILFQQAAMNAVNLSFQVDAMQTNNASQIFQFNTAIDQLLFMQANSTSVFNPLVNGCYLFFFNEDKVITKGSTGTDAKQFFEEYLRVDNATYADFKKRFTQEFYAGKIMPNVPIGYMQSTYHEWLLAQTIPLDTSLTHKGVILFTLDENALTSRLRDGLMDDDSICMLLSEGAVLKSEGKNRHWNDALTEELIALAAEDMRGTQYWTLSDGKKYMVTCVPCAIGRMISAQPQTAVFVSMNHYNTSMLLLVGGFILLAVVIAMAFTNRNVAAMNRVISMIPKEHQANSATNVYHYMEQAFLNARQKEALLAARAREQKSVLTENFIKSLLRGEWQTESDLLQEQDRVGLSLDAPAYAVLLVHFWEKPDSADFYPGMRDAFKREFGEGRAFLAGMSNENVACLLLADDSDLRESIEAVAEEFSKTMPVTTLASNTVTSILEVSQAYRQVRVMSRMVQEDETRLYWYQDLFQDDVLYNFEYSVYSEAGLRNNIAAGNEQGTVEILNDLYRKNLKSSVYSDHVLRFFAYDLYRLVNHLGTANASEDRKDALDLLRRHLDQVMDNPKRFETYFEEIKAYCLQMCRQNEHRRAAGSDEMMDKINQYIDAHFADPDLTVSSIADALGISGKYLSLFYKEQTSEKISAVIEKKRIDHACLLLDTTDMTINDIALASGYALTHTFRVAFKKIQGVTPLEWKKSRS